MNYSLKFKKYKANFIHAGGTSRGVLHHKTSYVLHLSHPDYEKPGFGEISLIPQLSPEQESDVEDFLNRNQRFDNNTLNQHIKNSNWPAITFGLEMAKKSLEAQALENFGEGKMAPIETNGLIWMGSFEEMLTRTHDKIQMGFLCIKFKVGALNFEEELNFLKKIREKFGDTIEIRLDANGAFAPKDALEKLKRLSDLGIHSIEQPIKAKQWDDMALLCKQSPIAIALDEELIGIKSSPEKSEILDHIQPHYIILKNSLLGGFTHANDWIKLAEKRGIKWWSTSALELNIGLNAIAYHLHKFNNPLPQGLGTGQVFSNNLDSNLKLHKTALIKSNTDDLLFRSCLNLFNG